MPLLLHHMLDISLNKDDFELAMISTDIKNELTILDLVKSDSSYHYSNWKSENLDNLVNEVMNNNNDDKIELLERAFKDELPYIGLYFRNDTLLTNRSVKGSIEPLWSNPYDGIVTWCK